MLSVHVRCNFPCAIVGKFTRGTPTTDMYFNANHRGSQHRSGILPSFTIFQSLNFIICNPFFKPLSSFLSHLPKLDFAAQRIQYRKLMTVFEMWCDPFLRQCMLAFNTNGKVVFAIISEILNEQILFINVHYNISLLHVIINYFRFHPSSYTLSNAYSTCLSVRMLSGTEHK